MSSLNIVFMNILRSINLNRQNIVLTDFIKLLNYQDFEKLLAAIEKIKLKKPEFSFIMMQSQTDKFPFLKQSIYAFKDNKFESVKLKNEIDDHYLTYRKNLFNNYGIKYTYENERIFIDKKKYL
jgi:hypothetical protein